MNNTLTSARPATAQEVQALSTISIAGPAQVGFGLQINAKEVQRTLNARRVPVTKPSTGRLTYTQIDGVIMLHAHALSFDRR